MKHHNKIISILSLALLLSFLPGLIGGAQPAIASPAAAGRAHIVVQFSSNNNIVRPVELATDVSGIDALRLSGLPYEVTHAAWGDFVCSINGVGCCESPTKTCSWDNSWNYYQWDGSAWKSSSVGAGSSTVSAGGIEGWRWGPWDSGELPNANPLLSAQRGLEWLANQQDSQGGYGNASSSAETLLALASNQVSAKSWKKSSSTPSLMDFFYKNSVTYANASASASGKLATASSVSASCWMSSAKQPSAYYDAATGNYTRGSGGQAWAILGERSLNREIPAAAVEALKQQVKSNGGWEWDASMGTDTNSTSLAIQALIAAGEPKDSTIISNGLAYLKSAQNSDGGFPYDPQSKWGTASDVDSTAYVIQAILAAGQDPNSASWTPASASPIQYLISMQLADGSFEWQKGQGGNALATQQAIPALLEHSMPFVSLEMAACPNIYLPSVHK